MFFLLKDIYTFEDSCFLHNLQTLKMNSPYLTADNVNNNSIIKSKSKNCIVILKSANIVW